MPYKQIFFRSDAREKILRGAAALADAVRVTLGPKSKCVLIGKKWGRPLVCNDGVTIAKEVELKDPEENLGAQMLREAAERTGDVVGDGTTTSTILAYAILAEGCAQYCRRSKRNRSQARHRCRCKSRSGSRSAISRPVESRRNGHKSQPFPHTTTRPSVNSWQRPWRESGLREQLRLRKPKGWRRPWKLSKECSSIAVFYRHISLRIPRRWKWFSRIH